VKFFTTLKREPKKARQVLSRNGKMIAKNAVLPFHNPLTGRIKNVLKSNDINTCFRNRGKLSDLIGCVKTSKPQREKSGIYRIACEDEKCPAEYRGQTKRRLETREKEHKLAVKNQDIKRSSVARHFCGSGHKMGVIDLMKQVDNPCELDAYESLFIELGQNLMNEGDAPISSKLFSLGDDIKKKKKK
jgi:hypothetical protein